MKWNAKNVPISAADTPEQISHCSSDASTVNMEHCLQENSADCVSANPAVSRK